MFGWTLLDTVLGGDALELLGGVDFAPVDEDERRDDELVLPDYVGGLLSPADVDFFGRE